MKAIKLFQDWRTTLVRSERTHEHSGSEREVEKRHHDHGYALEHGIIE